MGAFNEWTRGTYLESYENRHVVDAARHILNGCAYLYRVKELQMQGVRLDHRLMGYRPENPVL